MELNLFLYQFSIEFLKSSSKKDKKNNREIICSNQFLKVSKEVLENYERNRLELLYSIEHKNMELKDDSRYVDEITRQKLIDELNNLEDKIIKELSDKAKENIQMKYKFFR